MAAPPLNNVQTNAIASAAVTLASYVVGSESDRVLVVCVGWETAEPSSSDISGVTFGGVGLTKAADIIHDTGTENGCDIWYLINPTASTADIVTTFSGDTPSQSLVHAFYLSGAKQTGVPDSTQTGTSTSSPHDETITTVAANCQVIAAWANSHADDLTARTSDAEIAENSEAATVAFMTARKAVASAGGSTMGCERTGTWLRSAGVLVSFAPVAAATAIPIFAYHYANQGIG